MPGRQYTGATGYRYGFGGQEKDDEVSGSGNSYSAEYWEYNSRLGIRWNMDPVVKPWESSYATFSNNPVLCNDPKGLDAEKRAKRYQKKHGGTIEKGENGKYSVNSARMFKDKYSSNGKGVDFATKEFKNGLFDQLSDAITSTVQKVGEWVSSTDFVVIVKGKVDVGVQAKVRGSAYGVVQGEIKLNLVNFELLSGEVDLTELGSDNPDAYSGNYIGRDGKVNVKQGVEGMVGLVGQKNSAGAVYENSFTLSNGTPTNEKSDWGLYAVVPLLEKKNSNDIGKDVARKAVEAMGLDKPMQIKDSKIGNQKDFYGVDLGVGAALVLGVDVGLKVGFKR